MLIDDFLPAFDLNEVHGIAIQASPGRIFRSIKDLSPSRRLWLRAIKRRAERG